MTEKERNDFSADAEILYSRVVKAGKRVYYMDVKSDRRGITYLALTESKRVARPGTEAPYFEKHKIFIYPEDFDKFSEAFTEVLSYAREQGPAADHAPADAVSPIRLDLDF